MVDRSQCEAVVRQLWPYLDGAVPDAQREFITAHLEMCVNCSSHFEFAQAFLDAVAAARSAMPVDERLRGRVMGALAASGFSLGGGATGS
jgi:anti-sigma factor (TIGR02949 family)